MKFKRLVSIALLSVFLISFCSFSSFADDLNASDFSVLLGRETPNSSGGVTTDYFTYNVTTGNRFGVTVLQYTPNDWQNFWKSGAVKIMTAFESPGLIAGHDYSISFVVGVNFNATPLIEVFLDSQKIYSGRLGATGGDVSINFTAPDFVTSSTSIRVECSIDNLYQDYGTSSTCFFLSKTIEFNDDTDNPGWLGKILQNFTNLGDRISGFFSNLTSSISDFFSSLGDRISGFFSDLKNTLTDKFNNLKQWFVDLGDSIGDFFDMLKDYLLYFEHPVTLDSNGVPIGADGKPVYTNPFASKIDEFKQTVNGWLAQIKDFVNQIDSAGNSVSSYIENGSTIVGGVLTAVPVLTAVLTFALVLLVVRKVVGR